MSANRNVLDLSIGDTFLHPLYGKEALLVRVTGPVFADETEGYDKSRHRVLNIPVEVVGGHPIGFEVGETTTLVYTPGAEVILAEAPAERDYAIGIPVGITVQADGTVVLDFDLSEAEQIGEDEAAWTRYGEAAVTEDSKAVRKALQAIGNTHTITLTPNA